MKAVCGIIVTDYGVVFCDKSLLLGWSRPEDVKIMLIEERHNLIVELATRKGTVSKKELADTLGVSLETVRRDIEVLSHRKLVRKVHGGVAMPKFTTGKYPELNYMERQQTDLTEKEDVAAVAVKRITDGMSIAMNSGTTNEVLARALLHKFHRLTVLTNSLSILSILREDSNIRVILCGGTYNRTENAFFGVMTEEFMRQFSVDIFFLAVSGVDLERGCTNYSEDEAGLQRIMLMGAAEVVALAMAKKLNTVSLIVVCHLDDVDCIITDSTVAPDVVSKYREAGFQLVAGTTGDMV